MQPWQAAAAHQQRQEMTDPAALAGSGPAAVMVPASTITDPCHGSELPAACSVRLVRKPCGGVTAVSCSQLSSNHPGAAPMHQAGAWQVGQQECCSAMLRQLTQVRVMNEHVACHVSMEVSPVCHLVTPKCLLCLHQPSSSPHACLSPFMPPICNLQQPAPAVHASCSLPCSPRVSRTACSLTCWSKPRQQAALVNGQPSRSGTSHTRHTSRQG